MSLKPIQINVIEKNQKRNVNFNDEYKLTNTRREGKNDCGISDKETFLSTWQRLKLKFVKVLQSKENNDSNLKTQLDIFQSSMKYCIVNGKCLGVLPITNMAGRDIQKLKYNIIFTWKYLFCWTILLFETLAAGVSLYGLVFKTFSLSTIRYAVFYTGNLITSALFIRLSTKWYHLLEVVATSKLDEYVDSSVKFKCKFATIALMVIAFLEHIILKTYKILRVYNCRWPDRHINSYEQYLQFNYSWAFDLNFPFSIGIGILLQIFSFVTALIWTYSHLFIICISLYLASILEMLNKKIISFEDKDIPPSHWRALREDYNRATLLVRSFDAAINSITFVLTASDLFFVCCQVYYLIGEIITGSTLRPCPKNPWGILIGYEYSLYLIISVVFYITRFFAVLLIAAKVHTASLMAVPSLYNVSPSSYCSEVQRFIEKINGDTVALTGLNFFYTTRDMILSVVGTIVTYELVLLQFNRN